MSKEYSPEYRRQQYEKHKERRKAESQDYYRRNRDKMREKQREYYQRNRDKMIERTIQNRKKKTESE